MLGVNAKVGRAGQGDGADPQTRRQRNHQHEPRRTPDRNIGKTVPQRGPCGDDLVLGEHPLAADEAVPPRDGERHGDGRVNSRPPHPGRPDPPGPPDAKARPEVGETLGAADAAGALLALFAQEAVDKGDEGMPLDKRHRGFAGPSRMTGSRRGSGRVSAAVQSGDRSSTNRPIAALTVCDAPASTFACRRAFRATTGSSPSAICRLAASAASRAASMLMSAESPRGSRLPTTIRRRGAAP